MKKLFMLLVMSLILAANSAWSYDTQLAKRYEQFFSPFAGKNVSKSFQAMKVPDLLKAIKSKQDLVILDVRTWGEQVVIGFYVPGSLAIPIAELFKPENLAKLPTDKKIVVVCKKGFRASFAAMSLRQIGFKDVYIVKGGIDAIAAALSPKSIY